jgi:hypothetical protein
MSGAALTSSQALFEARAICRQLRGTVWFREGARFDPKRGAFVPTYCIYRRGMGCVAERGSVAALLAYMRTQRPPV